MKYILIISLIVFASCNQESKKENQVQKATSPHYNITLKDTSRYAIINDSSDKVKKPFTLSDSELIAIEGLIKKEVLKDGNRIKNPLKYYKQLVQTINAKGEKVVWVNCFCREKADWKKRIVVVMDGGKCYFSLIVNLTNKTVHYFIVNGQA